MTVSDLLDRHSYSWNINLVRQLFVDEDVAFILNTKLAPSQSDLIVWGLSETGRYDSKSGYKLIETLVKVRSGIQVTIPPLEKQLWSKL